MRKDDDQAVSTAIGAVMFCALVSLMFGIIYSQALPQMQNFADQMRISPTVVSTYTNGTLTLMMQSGLPVEGGWSLYVNDTLVSSGLDFFVGKPITAVVDPNSTVYLVENSRVPRMVYYAKLGSDIAQGSEDPEDPQGEFYLVNWTEKNNNGGFTVTGNEVTFESTYVDRYWMCPINITGDFTVIAEINETGVDDARLYFGIGETYLDEWNVLRYRHTSEMKSTGTYYYFEFGAEQVLSSLDPYGVTRSWEQTIHRQSERVDYALGNDKVTGKSYTDTNAKTPNYVFCYTLDSKCCLASATIKVMLL